MGRNFRGHLVQQLLYLYVCMHVCVYMHVYICIAVYVCVSLRNNHTILLSNESFTSSQFNLFHLWMAEIFFPQTVLKFHIYIYFLFIGLMLFFLGKVNEFSLSFFHMYYM